VGKQLNLLTEGNENDETKVTKGVMLIQNITMMIIHLYLVLKISLK